MLCFFFVSLQLLEALDALKCLGVLHTDIKPDNIMLVNMKDQPLRVKLIDFGCAMMTSEIEQGMEIQPWGYQWVHPAQHLFSNIIFSALKCFYRLFTCGSCLSFSGLQRSLWGFHSPRLSMCGGSGAYWCWCTWLKTRSPLDADIKWYLSSNQMDFYLFFIFLENVSGHDSHDVYSVCRWRT